MTVEQIDKTTDDATIEVLAPADEFHIGGRTATQHLLRLLEFSVGDNTLGIGCGLGGAARYMAAAYDTRVTGIDLTQSFVAVSTVLNSWVGMNGQVTLLRANRLSRSFEDAEFDGSTLLHVGINIENKHTDQNQKHGG